MSSKDKLIGIALILIGIGCIALGVMTGMKPTVTNNNQVYTEQNTENNVEQLPTDVNEPTVNVYTEDTNTDDQVVESDQQQETTESDDEESTRYIY